MLNVEHITTQEFRTLLTVTIDGTNDDIINFAGIDLMLVIIIISLVIHILSLKWFDNCAKYENLIRYKQ